MHVPLTCACCVHCNVCSLLITLFIKYLTVVDSIHTTSSPVQKYHHMISCSVEVPLATTARNSSSIGKEPVPLGFLHNGISIRRSTTRSIVSGTVQGITVIIINVLHSHNTVVIEYCTFECEPNFTQT